MGSRALIIGPGKYWENPVENEPKLQDFDEIADSASLYGEILRADGQWGPDRVEVLPAGKLDATRDVMQALERAARDSKDGTLLVVYIGHGRSWPDVAGAEVHFAVGSSLPDQPFTWLSSSYVYRTMRKSHAEHKILIADCCYSGRLGQLGPAEEDLTLRDALRSMSFGTCVVAAVKNASGATGHSCQQLAEERFRKCTTFSGHLLSVLSHGVPDGEKELTICMIYDAVRGAMDEHEHDLPGIILNDARDPKPLFSNKTKAARRGSPDPDSPKEWAAVLVKRSDYGLGPLLADPAKAGKVVTLLSRLPNGTGQHAALRVNWQANEKYADANEFARYWVEAAQALAQ